MAVLSIRLKDKDLIESLYVEPPVGFNIMDCAKTYMLANVALHSTDDEARYPLNKQSKKSKRS